MDDLWLSFVGDSPLTRMFSADSLYLGPGNRPDEKRSQGLAKKHGKSAVAEEKGEEKTLERLMRYMIGRAQIISKSIITSPKHRLGLAPPVSRHFCTSTPLLHLQSSS